MFLRMLMYIKRVATVGGRSKMRPFYPATNIFAILEVNTYLPRNKMLALDQRQYLLSRP